jgi:plasmid stabilization system protein ParE
VSLSIVTAPQADSQIETIDAWWRTNRSASPNLFSEELAAGFELIASAPDIGHLDRRAPLLGVRRILLRATRYHVYYIRQRDVVVVLAVWHTKRGTKPTLA